MTAIPRKRAFIIAAEVLLLAGLVVGLGCSRSSGPSDRRLLFIGIDSADWRVVNPLIAQGKMPNLADLMESGVSCDLRSLEPKEKSPVIWATIATGKMKDKHGVGDFIDDATDRLMTSNMWKARAFWDIIGDEGLTVSVIGWLTSWPASEINGYMVADYFRFRPREGRDLPERLTYPVELVEELEGCRTVAEDITDEQLARFASYDKALTSSEAQQLPTTELFDEMRAINTLDQSTYSLKDILAGDMTFMEVARHVMTRHRTQVFVCYLRGVDTASHKFWSAAHRGEVGFKVSRTQERVFGETVNRYYEFADEMLGELVEEFGPGATVIVCSDHGFDGPKPGRPHGGINDHGPRGVLVMVGEGIREGVTIGEQHVRDITPTVLALYDLPVADDMDGQIIDDAFTEEFCRGLPRSTVATYELEQR